jgi:hypothetical protein
MRVGRTAILLAGCLVVGCEDDSPDVIREYAGELTVYGALLRSDGSRVQGRVVGTAQVCPDPYPEPVDSFIVLDGAYRVAVGGVIGGHPTCVELRFQPDPGLGLGIAVARVSVPFRSVREPSDSVELDIVLSTLAVE